MGRIEAKGRLMFSRARFKSHHAPYGGCVSQYEVSSSRDPAVTNVIEIRCRDLDFIQESYINCNGSPDYAEELRNAGFTDWQLQNILINKKIIKYFTISCPSYHKVANKLKPGIYFRKFDVIFEHGPLAVECDIPSECARFIEPNALAYIQSSAWNNGKYGRNGRVSHSAQSFYRDNARLITIEPDYSMHDLPIGTELRIFIDLPNHDAIYDSQEIFGASHLENKSETISNNHISGAYTRGTGENNLSLWAEEELKKKSQLANNALSLQIAEGGTIPIKAPLDPAIPYPVPAGLQCLTLTTLWAVSQIETVPVIRTIARPFLRVRGRIGTAAELDLYPRPLVDSVSIQIIPNDRPLPLYVRLHANEMQYKKISSANVRLLLHLSKGSYEITGKPYGRSIDKFSSQIIFGMQLPREFTVEAADMSPWVEAADYAVHSPLMLPSRAEQKLPPGVGRVIAHVGRGRLAMLDLKIGNTSISQVEVHDDRFEFMSVVADINQFMVRLRMASKGKREEGRIEKFLNSLTAII